MWPSRKKRTSPALPRAFHVSQPSLSRQILDLEDELQLALFEHNAKTVRLTVAGRIFLFEARAVLQRVAEAVQTVKAVGSGEKGELHVGYAPSLTTRLLPQALSLFQKEASGVGAVLHDYSTEKLLDGLREGELQIALLKQPPDKSLRGLTRAEREAGTVLSYRNPTRTRPQR